MKAIKKLTSGFALSNNQGIAIIAALMALLVLTAVGALVFTITTKDIRVATRIIGEKKAFSGAESGVHYIVTKANEFAKEENFKSLIKNFSEQTTVNSSIDEYTRYVIHAGYSSTTLIVTECDAIFGSSFGLGGETAKPSGQGFLFHKGVTGENTRYGSKVQLDVGHCYGPIPPGTAGS